MIDDPSYRRSPLCPPGAGEVGNVVLRRIHDPVLLMHVDHRRLDVGMAQHGLNLSVGVTVLLIADY